MVSATHIKSLSQEHGFDLCGVIPTSSSPLHRRYFESWLAHGYAGELEYMRRYQDVRFDPTCLMTGAQSVIVCAVNYKSDYSLSTGDSDTPRIASYALTRDYHKTIRKALKSLLRELQNLYPSLSGRCCVDTAPLLEKQLAIDAGLGWRGRNSLLITPEYGSFVLLGEIIIDSVVDSYDSPYGGDGCGECRRCVDSCPTSALTPDRTVDTRRCISAQTVECENTSDIPLNGWIFGCDECQQCCPHNRKTPLFSNPQFTPIATPLTVDEWQRLNDAEFSEIYGSTPLKRAGLPRIFRALGYLGH